MHPADLARMSAKAKGEMPGRTKEAEKKASEVGTEIGQKIDSAVSIPVLLSYHSVFLSLWSDSFDLHWLWEHADTVNLD